MELEMTFKLLRPAGGDCCAPYEILLNRECTLRELVDCILKNDRDWGYITICGRVDDKKVEYRYGKNLKNEFTENELNSILLSVGSYGGWSRMDYVVKLK
jgi:hypothetical protein